MSKPEVDGGGPDRSGQNRWSNWSGNVSFRPAQISSPRSVEELVELISSAPGRIRPVGSGHSFTALAATEETLVSLHEIEGDILSIDSNCSRARLNAGASLHQLSVALEHHGLGFKNLGDIDVQSLAGATSTATHGTGMGFPCLSAEIEEATLVTASGELLSIGPGANSELLHAVQVSLGALGIVVDATVSVRPAYKLHRTTAVRPLSDTLVDAMDLWEAHRNYEFFTLPFCDYAFNVTHDETTEADRRVGQGDDEASLRDLRRLRTLLSWSSPLRRFILNQVAKRTATEDVVGTSWRLLANERNTVFNEMEYHIPVDQGLDALAEVVHAIDSLRDVYFPVECRRTAADESWLSPFHGGERISIAVHAGRGDDVRWLFDTIEPIMRRRGGRPHWGKLHSMSAPDLRDLYPEFDRFSRLRRELDPHGVFLNPHTATLWGEALDA